ncbi:MAG: hypothetical protein KAV87_49245 [Desulfobacteraceae bacterium]|nr:hypothetical protein [Desulfobacteraceae bacterium]
MVLELAETRSGETNPRLRPSLFQEWTNREFLIMLNREIQSLLEEKLESFHSNVATITGVSEMTIENDFWKAPFFYIEIETKLATENETRIYDDPQEELSQFRESVHPALIGPRISEKVEDLLDWDAHIETPPPPRRSGTIKVRFKYVGRSKPIPIDDPWA